MILLEQVSQIIRKMLHNREAKNASWIILGKITQMIISFIVGILTARYLGPANYGLINYGATYVLFFTPLCTLGINSIIVKNFAEYPNEVGETIGTALLLKFLSSVISIASIFLIVSIVDRGYGEVISVVALSSLSLMFGIFDTFQYWFQFNYNSKVGAISGVIAYTIVATYRLFLLVRGENILWFAFGTSLDYICTAIMSYSVYIRSNGPQLRASLKKAETLLKESHHFILSGVMVAVYSQTDKFMLKQMADETILGMYSLASSLNFVWVFVLQAIIDSMYPTIMSAYKKDRCEFERKNRQLYAIVIFTSVSVACIFCAFGTPIIKILYGDAYVPAVAPLRIIAWYTTFSYLGVARNAWIVCENKQKYLKYIYTSAAVLNVVMNAFFIPRWGASGAAVASLVTQILTGIILPYFIKELRPNTRLMIDATLLKNIKK